MPTEIQLTAQQIEEIGHYCRAVVPECEVLVYGSRAKGTAKQASDLDLAIRGSVPVAMDKILHLKNIFVHSYLPFSVDLTDLSAVSPEFRALILKEAVPFPPSPSQH